MPLNIKDEATREMARELARRNGTSMSRAVKQALADALEAERAKDGLEMLAADLDSIALVCAALPVRDGRAANDIIGYDGRGLPE